MTSSILPRHRALALLSECNGDEIWSEKHCRDKNVPDDWIEELKDAFESGYQSDSQTIYVDDQGVNQYHGVRDVDLAMKLGECLGIDVRHATSMAISRRAVVNAIKEALLE